MRPAAGNPPAPPSPAIQQSLNLAVQHHQAGRLPEAEGLYQQILQTDPKQPVALQLSGVIAFQRGDIKTILIWALPIAAGLALIMGLT